MAPCKDDSNCDVEGNPPKRCLEYINYSKFNYSGKPVTLGAICGNYKLCEKFSMIPDVAATPNKSIIAGVHCCDVVANGDPHTGGTLKVCKGPKGFGGMRGIVSSIVTIALTSFYLMT